MSEGQAPPAPPARTGPKTAPSGLPWKWIGIIVLAVYSLILLLVNSEKVAIDFVFFEARTRLIWLILLSMALGALIGVLGPGFLRRRRERRASSSSS